MVIPTYNERENIRELIPKILRVEEKNLDEKWSLSILVVDDNSPDGTAEVVEELSSENGEVRLLQRDGKKGLGTAYIDGFEYAMNELDADVLVEMDADLSHDPEDLPRLLQKIEEGYDFVIGSRRVGEGKAVGWSFRKKMTSWMGNFLARVVTGFRVSDCTSGFRAINSSFFSNHSPEFSSDGYAFQLELLHYVIQKGANIAEVPIIFRERKRGKSKLGKDELIEFTKTGFKLGLAKTSPASDLSSN